MKRILLSIILIVVLPGCEPFSKSHPQMAEVWPVYSVPAQPKLDIPAGIVPNKNPDMDKMIKNMYDLTVYADSLKLIIETHNTASKAHNTKVEQDLGVGQK